MVDQQLRHRGIRDERLIEAFLRESGPKFSEGQFKELCEALKG